MSPRLAAIFALQCSIAACGGSGGRACTTDDQCPSHFCRADGTCAPGDFDAGSGSDAAPGSDAAGGTCMPNHDGTIELDELPMAAGKMANFRIATNATWDTSGTSSGSGSRTWDLTGQLSNDADHAIALAAPAGAWWAGDFPDATYATPLSESSSLIGVFELTPNSLLLLGVVSPDGGTTRTELTYDPPAEILAIPFDSNSTWSSSSSVTGTASGVIAAYSESYDSQVDAVGTMTTPYGMFPVLRVATDLSRTSGVTTLLTNRTFAWVAECFGPVATVQSQSFETGEEFSNDAEVRRLIP